MLNIRTTTYYFLVIVCLFVRSKPSAWTHITWYWHKRSHAKSNLTQNDSKLSCNNSRAPISNVDVKNIKSAGWAGFAPSQRKLLKRLDDILLENDMLLQKIKGHF